MPKLPRLNAKQFIKILQKLGFREARQESSHKIFRNMAGVRVTVPCHGERVLHPKIIKTFIRDAGVALTDFEL